MLFEGGGVTASGSTALLRAYSSMGGAVPDAESPHKPGSGSGRRAPGVSPSDSPSRRDDGEDATKVFDLARARSQAVCPVQQQGVSISLKMESRIKETTKVMAEASAEQHKHRKPSSLPHSACSFP